MSKTNSNINKEKREQIHLIIQDKMPKANVFVAKLMICTAAVSILFWFILQFGIYKTLHRTTLTYVLVFDALIIIAIALYALHRKGHGKYTKYILLITFTLFLFLINYASGYRLRLLAAAPLLLTMKYYDKKLLDVMFYYNLVLSAISAVLPSYTYKQSGTFNINNLYFTEPVTLTIKGFPIDEFISLDYDANILFQVNFVLSLIPVVAILVIYYAIIKNLMENNLQVLLSVEDYSQKEIKQKLELAELREKITISQIQPHFLYNSLSSIAALCTKNPEEAKKLTINFSRYVRTNMNSLTTKLPVPFSDELKHVKTYVDIEKVRFDDLLNVQFDIATEDFDIPTLTLQPIVENAIKHGVCKKEDVGNVYISSYDDDNNIYICVKDDGVGFDTNILDSLGDDHIGIKNIKSRLKSQVNGDLKLESEIGKGTTALITIPKAEGTN